MSGGHAGGHQRGVDVDAVTALVEHVAATVVAPRFRALAAQDVTEKSPGDLVTVVDTEAEIALTDGLGEILPGVPVVGEEATYAHPERLALLDQPLAFVVDPVDGTQAFVDGSPEYAVMVALVERGEAVAGWICLPERGETYVAERGAGAYRNGRRLVRPAPSSDRGAPRVGVAATVPERHPWLGARLARAGEGFVISRELWSGAHYARLASGDWDALVYLRTFAWDHAPGAVIVRELGGVSRRVDGRDYRPSETGDGLIAAADAETFARVLDALGLTGDRPLADG